MAEQFFSALMGKPLTMPNAMINDPSMGPLPPTVMPAHAPIGLRTPDGDINNPDRTRLLEGLERFVYSIGPNPQRIETQTQINHPNRVARIIPKLFLPSAQSDSSSYQDPILEHATNDGDFVFSLKLNRSMTEHGSRYVLFPAGTSDRVVKVVNLATVNYILWGLQVGSLLPGNKMWLTFFRQLCRTDHEALLERLSAGEDDLQELVWNFIRTYIGPFGVQHGSDRQGGLQEGGRVVTYGSDYVSSFAIEGKILKINNYWKACDVYEDDDLVFALRRMPPQCTPVMFNLSSSIRSIRTERAPVPHAWWYLNPEVLRFKSILDTPHVHVGRSQKMITAYARPNFGGDMTAWNARACIQGLGLQMTLEPCFMASDALRLKHHFGVKPRHRTAATRAKEPQPQPQDAPPVTASHAFVFPKPKHARPDEPPPATPAELAFANALEKPAKKKKAPVTDPPQ